MDPSQRNSSVQCDYHKDHRHETNRCRSLKFLVGRLIKAGHLRRYFREVDRGAESGPLINIITTGVAVLPESRPSINYILGGPSDDQYQSKHQHKKLLRATTVKARVNAIHKGGGCEETKPIDDYISFPPVNLNKVIMPHYDSLVLIICISSFDAHRVLVDPGRAADLLQLPAFNQMKLSLGMLNSGDVMFPVQAGLVTQ